MDIYEALYTTRTMRRMRPDPIPLGTQARILDAAIRAPNGGNTQRWHFLVVDDHELKRKLAELYRRARDLEHEEFKNGTMALPAPGADRTAYAETLRRIIRSGNYLADHFEEVPLLLFVFAIDDHGGANVFPAIWECAAGRPRRGCRRRDDDAAALFHGDCQRITWGADRAGVDDVGHGCLRLPVGPVGRRRSPSRTRGLVSQPLGHAFRRRGARTAVARCPRNRHRPPAAAEPRRTLLKWRGRPGLLPAPAFEFVYRQSRRKNL